MSNNLNRRSFIKGSLMASASAALVAQDSINAVSAAETPPAPTAQSSLPCGKIGGLSVSRALLGGNLLTHYTHSRDLQYVYALAAHYNTEEKILQTLALAEQHGINTLSIHVVPSTLAILKKHRVERGGKMQWIVCPTAPIEGDLDAFKKQVDDLVKDRTEALYIWGVRSDELVQQGKVDVLGRAVELVKSRGVPCGVGAHDLNVVVECEKNKVPADFYIKTFHHHVYPSAPKPEQLTRVHNEVPGYWCKNPQETMEFMANVRKPWIAFKIMAAGAIPPNNAIKWAFKNGADHVLLGMFDFEIAEDARIVTETLANVTERKRPWQS